MSVKIIVVGANHAGTAALNTILDYYPDCSVTAFDANSNISFLGCGMALWIGGQISGPDGLFYSNKKLLEEKGAKVHMETLVTRIDFERKEVFTENKKGEKGSEKYDKLILATGSVPVRPTIPGIDLCNVQFVKLYQNAIDVIEKLKDLSLKKITVVGAGYIGVELAEAFQRIGKKVTLIDCAHHCLSSYYDEEFCIRMEENLKSHGIELLLGESVIRLEGRVCVEKVVTDCGSYETDMVVFGIGFLPNTVLAQNEVTQFKNGAYLTDRRQQTSRKDVYAVGDCATVFDNAQQKISYIALATNAVRSGIIAAHNACGTDLESPGVQGSNGISIWDLKMVSTGLTLIRAEKMGYDAAVTDYEDYQKAGFLETENPKTKIRLVYDRKTRIILGAQMCSEYDISMGIHLFSLAIQEQVTIDKLKLMDLFFLPHFNQPYNYITMAAIKAD